MASLDGVTSQEMSEAPLMVDDESNHETQPSAQEHGVKSTAGLGSSIFNLTNSIIGAGVLGLPYTFMVHCLGDFASLSSVC